MPGRFYFKHTLNHIVDNQLRINQLNISYKKSIIANAIQYLSTTSDNQEEKVIFLQKLTHDTYRYGRKYKYDCNLHRSEIGRIIKTVGDEDLFVAYFGHTKQDDSFKIVAVIFIIFIFVILLCSIGFLVLFFLSSNLR